MAVVEQDLVTAGVADRVVAAAAEDEDVLPAARDHVVGPEQGCARRLRRRPEGLRPDEMDVADLSGRLGGTSAERNRYQCHDESKRYSARIWRSNSQQKFLHYSWLTSRHAASYQPLPPLLPPSPPPLPSHGDQPPSSASPVSVNGNAMPNET